MIEKIKKAIKEKNLVPKAFCYLLIKMGFSNMNLQALEMRNLHYEQLKKKYANIAANIFKKYNNVSSEEEPRIIWFCWLQGIDNAPELVKRCYNSIVLNASDWEINVVTKENLGDFVEMDKVVLEKWKEGTITNAHFSDILRTELLIKYGGLWIDSTVLIVDELPDYIMKSDIFMFTHSNPDDVTISYNSWFIFSRPQNQVLLTLRDLLNEYWAKENHLKDYFMWHLMLTMILEICCSKNRLVNYYVSDEIPETLARIVFEQFDPNIMKTINQICPIHKLSNKLSIPKDIEGSFYEKILLGELQ